MAEAIARIDTPRASDHLRALCARWARGLEAEFGTVEGRVNFEVAAAHLHAEPGRLTLHLIARDEATLARLARAVAQRLRRLGGGEALIVAWDCAA